MVPSAQQTLVQSLEMLSAKLLFQYKLLLDKPSSANTYKFKITY